MNDKVQLGTGKKRHRNKCDLFSQCKIMNWPCQWRTFIIYLTYYNGKIFDFFSKQKGKAMKVFQEGRTIYWKWLTRTTAADVFCINFPGDTWIHELILFFFKTHVKNKAIPYLHINSTFHAFESLPKYQNNNLLFCSKISIRTEQLKKGEIQNSSSLQFWT